MDAEYKLGYVLSGGGTRAIAQLGTLAYLEEIGLKPDVISGCSAGTLVGLMYSCGYTPAQMFEIIKDYRLFRMIRFKWTIKGLTTLEGLRRELDILIGYDQLEDLPIPLHICTTELCSGQTEIFNKGSVLDLAIASCSIPLLFTPVQIEDKLYADGGMLMNLPARPIRSLCTYLIGLNVLPLGKVPLEHLKTGRKAGLRSLELGIRNNAIPDKAICDLVIEPSRVGKYGLFQFNKADDLFDLGYQEAKRQHDALCAIRDS